MPKAQEDELPKTKKVVEKFLAGEKLSAIELFVYSYQPPAYHSGAWLEDQHVANWRALLQEVIKDAKREQQEADTKAIFPAKTE